MALPQFGHLFSAVVTTNPQFLQVIGWTLPSGAPQAMQFDSPKVLGVLQ